jgi:hypothetical protein
MANSQSLPSFPLDMDDFWMLFFKVMLVWMDGDR